jgi:malate dehydrogenase
MTREELIGINAGIVKGVAENILKQSPNAIFIIVSNPMDTMTYLALKATGLPRNRIIGMGGILDSSRFKYYLSQAMNCAPNDLQGVVIGGSGHPIEHKGARRIVFETYELEFQTDRVHSRVH